METIYLDNAATTKPSKEALAVLQEDALAWNPSSNHLPGQQAKVRLEMARGVVATALGCEPREIIFTACGTESNALAILGVTALQRVLGHIVTTTLEHPSVARQVDNQKGWRVTRVAPDKTGHITPEMIGEACESDTKLVTCLTVCHETGTVLDIAGIVSAVRYRAPHAVIHSDGVQGFLKVDCNVKATGVDLLSVSAHKVHGVRGVGALYVKEGIKLRPLWEGGGQERGLRSGTEPLALIAAFAAAIAQPDDPVYLRSLIDYASEILTTQFPSLQVIPSHDAPHILTVSLPGCPGQVVQRMLSDLGVYVSTGSACSRGKTSAVLQSMKLPKSVIEGAIRVSVCAQNTLADIDALALALESVYRRFLGS